MNNAIGEANLNQSTPRKFSPEQALHLAIHWHQNDRVEDAEVLYRKLLELNPDDPNVMNFLGLARHQRGHSEEGITWIKKALALAPDYIDAENNLGNIYLLTGCVELAEPCFRHVIARNPDFATAYGNLGIALKDLERYQEAIEYLMKAIELEPDMPRHYQNLGNVYRHQQQYREAVAMYRKSLELAPFDPEAYLRLSRTFFIMGEIERSAEVLEQWLEYDPENPTALHMYAAYTRSNTPTRASDAYVKETFDSFAASFDVVLKRLDYQAPLLVQQALQKLEPEPDHWIILDAGCGTGLCGDLIRPLAKRLVGMDLSPKMLERAQARGIYDDLFEAELTEFFANSASAYHAITCVDTLCYFGDLTGVVQAAVKALRPDGWFVFTLEKHEADDVSSGFYLHEHGRYSHAEVYVRKALHEAGFRVHSMETATLRKERADQVAGLVVMAQSIAP